ncbi:MAG: PASTA domain-containing protein, partial [Solobacterium sp.]|nr:PASTA domain-containing protein [Solobacterium sp.]
PADKLSLCYGQGSTVTMLQMLQAYSAIFGDGNMVRPYFIESIRDAYDNHVIYQAETKITGTPITEESAKEIQRILYRVMNENDGTARHYRIDEASLMGKTGTAEVAINGNYNTGTTITSVMCAMPAEDPQVLVYYCFEAPYNPNGQYYTEPVRSLLRKTAMRLGFAKGQEQQENPEEIQPGDVIHTFEMPSVLNQSLEYAENKLMNTETNLYWLGNGNTVIDQYPASGSVISTGQKVFLLTDTNSFIMPDMKGWTRKDVTGLWAVTQFGFKLVGEGKVTSQSVPPGTLISRGTEIEVVFE